MKKFLLTLTVALAFILTPTVSATSLNEGFEKGDTETAYTVKTVTGDAGEWGLDNTGVFYNETKQHTGKHAARFGNNSNSSFWMNFDKTDGAGTLTFYGREWTTKDGKAVVSVQYSTDEGKTWIEAGTASIESETYAKFDIDVNQSGNVRIKFLQKSGKRALIDDIEITDYVEDEGNVKKPEISCADNLVTITAETGTDIYYTTDGTEPTIDENKKYIVPFNITEDVTVQAIAVKDGESSKVASYKATYTLIYTCFSDLIAQATKDEHIIVKCPMTVFYQNGQYLYVQDDCGHNMLIFGNNAPQNLVNGDMFTRLEGTYTTYYNLPEVKNFTLSEKTVGNVVTPTPKDVNDLGSLNVLDYHSIQGMRISNISNRSFKINYGDGSTVNGYNQFDLPLAEGTYDVVEAVVHKRNDAFQIIPTAIKVQAPVVEVPEGFNADNVVPLDKYSNEATKNYFEVKVSWPEGLTLHYETKCRGTQLDGIALEYSQDQADKDKGDSGKDPMLTYPLTGDLTGTATVSRSVGTVSATFGFASEGTFNCYVVDAAGNQSGTKKLQFTGKSTGVEDIVVDGENGEAVFYNMQGVRVANPAAGNLYIKVQGDKATKVLVK